MTNLDSYKLATPPESCTCDKCGDIIQPREGYTIDIDTIEYSVCSEKCEENLKED